MVKVGLHHLMNRVTKIQKELVDQILQNQASLLQVQRNLGACSISDMRELLKKRILSNKDIFDSYEKWGYATGTSGEAHLFSEKKYPIESSRNFPNWACSVLTSSPLIFLSIELSERPIKVWK